MKHKLFINVFLVTIASVAFTIPIGGGSWDEAFPGNVSINGTVTANKFVGDGSGLTGITALSSVTSDIAQTANIAISIDARGLMGAITVATGNEVVTVLENGNVGIGTANPVAQIDLTKDLNFPDTTASNIGIVKKAGSRFIHNFQASGTAGGNTFIGVYAGNTTKITGTGGEGSYNTGLGQQALRNLTTGSQNTGVGSSTMWFNSTGLKNTGLGSRALYANKTGSYNTAAGEMALGNAVSGNNNVAVGYRSLHELKNGNNNVAIGQEAGYYETGSNKLYIANSKATASTASSDALIYGEFDNDKLVFNADVGIGTSNPTAKLDVVGDIKYSGKTIKSPSSVATISTGNTITVIGSIMRVQADTASTIELGNPQIAAGQDGQIVILAGRSDTNMIKLIDGDGLSLFGGAPFTLGLGDTIRLYYDALDSVWYEISRTNN